MSTVVDKKQLDIQLTDWYFSSRDRLMATSSSLFNSLRPEAMESFRKLGIPDKSLESYLYTDIREIFLTPFNKYVEPRQILFSVEDMFHCDIPELDTELILLVNGWFYENRPKLETLQNGIIVGSMAEAARQYPALVGKYYSKYADFRTDGLVALNTAFAQDGTFIYIPKGAGNNKAFQIVNILLSPEDLFVQHRNLVIVEENATANVVVCDHSLSSHKFLTNSVTEIHAGQNARLNYFKLQNEHNLSNQVASSYLHQERDSQVIFNTVTLHGGKIRNNVKVKLNGEGADNQTLGLFLADKNQHIDNFTFIEHAAPNCTSNQNFKGILDDQATGAFTGRILVNREAQKTMAYQANNNILLSDDARMYTKPQLEIYADDVKCSHGATVGQLDENAMFYLRSRGISKREARLLLMYGFGSEILRKVNIEPLRERLDTLIDKRLRGELSRCNSCPLHCS